MAHLAISEKGGHCPNVGLGFRDSGVRDLGLGCYIV